MKKPWISFFASLFTLAPLLTIAAQAVPPTSDSISGSLELPASLHVAIKPDAVIYVIARDGSNAPGTIAGGPPMAVKRITQPFHFPIPFSISAQDAMMPGAPFAPKVRLTARLSQSGSATPVSPGDVEGAPSTEPVSVGATHVKIVLKNIKK